MELYELGALGFVCGAASIAEAKAAVLESSDLHAALLGLLGRDGLESVTFRKNLQGQVGIEVRSGAGPWRGVTVREGEVFRLRLSEALACLSAQSWVPGQEPPDQLAECLAKEAAASRTDKP